LDAFVGRVRAQASQPLCVGFGISTPVQARQVADMADGIIIGSRLVELVSKDGVRAAASFVRTVRQALDDM
jgi:tryptophan synthase alpha chain